MIAVIVCHRLCAIAPVLTGVFDSAPALPDMNAIVI
jgi:hypothetical protein